MVKWLMVVALALTLSSCSVMQKYCSDDNATYRAFLKTLVQMNMPLYPKEGVCTWVDS